MSYCLDDVFNDLRRYDKDFLIAILLGFIFDDEMPSDPYEDLHVSSKIWETLTAIHLTYLEDRNSNGK